MKVILRRINLIIFIIFASFSSAQAKLFLEPYVGLAKQEVHIADLVDIADSYALGVKVGLTFNNKFYVGGDYLQAGPYKYGPLLNDEELTHSMFGAGFGADYKIIRFWLGYYFDNEITVTKSCANLTGTAIKAGFGLVDSNKIRANLELVFHDITELNQLGFVSNIDNLKIVTTMVTVSFPINMR